MCATVSRTIRSYSYRASRQSQPQNLSTVPRKLTPYPSFTIITRYMVSWWIRCHPWFHQRIADISDISTSAIVSWRSSWSHHLSSPVRSSAAILRRREGSNSGTKSASCLNQTLVSWDSRIFKEQYQNIDFTKVPMEVPRTGGRSIHYFQVHSYSVCYI